MAEAPNSTADRQLEARRACLDIVAKPESDAILREFRASLVAVTAAAHTVEAVFGDIKYLIPRNRDGTSATRSCVTASALRSACQARPMSGSRKS